jgi:hypothetical protein
MASFIANLPTATPAQAQAILAAAREAGAAQEAEAPGAAPAALMAIKPGVERWDAKVGGGGSAADVQKLIVDTSVRELGGLPRPQVLMPDTAAHDDYDDKRVAPVEDTVWRVSVNVIALRLEADGDYHLVLQDESGATMVAEVPNPDSASNPPFVPADSPFFDDIDAARKAVDAQFKAAVGAKAFVPTPAAAEQPPTSAPGQQPQAAQLEPEPPRLVLVPTETFQYSKTGPNLGPAAQEPSQKIDLSAGPDAEFAMRIDATPAVVIGVGFFDRSHGQTGNAPNILELHPVLGITFPQDE